MLSWLVTAALVESRDNRESLPDTMPLAVSQKYQLSVVRAFINTNLAPLENPQSTFTVTPEPPDTNVPTLLIPSRVAKR